MDKLKDYVGKQNGEGGDAQDSNAGCMKVGCAVVAALFFIFVLLVSSGDRKPDSNEDVKTEVVDEAARAEDWLVAKARFSEYREGDRLFPAQEPLNKGDVITAVTLYGARNARQYPDTDKERRFRDVIQSAMDEQSGRNPADDFAYQVNKYYLPELDAIDARQATFSNETKLLGQFEEFQRVLDDLGSTKFEGDNKTALDRFVALLEAKQSEIFPALRKARIEQMQSVLFRQNVEVSSSGRKNDRVTFEGWAFADNANIQDNYETIYEMLSRLRFKKAIFRTPISSSKYYTYTLETPDDAYLKLPK